MELLFEFLFELFFEGSISIAKNTKVSKRIRYPLAVLILIFVFLVIGIIAFAGIKLMINSEDSAGLAAAFLLIALDLILIISAAKNIIREIKKRNVKDKRNAR